MVLCKFTHRLQILGVLYMLSTEKAKMQYMVGPVRIAAIASFAALLLSGCNSDTRREEKAQVTPSNEATAVHTDNYHALLHASSMEEQREALNSILRDTPTYIPRLQQDLRDYRALVRTERVAANRAAYLAALVRNPSFPTILAPMLGTPEVRDECIYDCAVVFALTIHALFDGWIPPPDLDSTLTTVHDLKSNIQRVPQFTLTVGTIFDRMEGPGVERARAMIEGKTEEQLIQLAGPATSSADSRELAAQELSELVVTSKNLVEFYLLAMNDVESDASGQYRGAIDVAIYRAELARARGL